MRKNSEYVTSFLQSHVTIATHLAIFICSNHLEFAYVRRNTFILFYFIFWSWFYENREDKTQERCDPSPQLPIRGYFFSVNNTPAAPLGSGHQGACRIQPGKRVRQGPMKEGTL